MTQSNLEDTMVSDRSQAHVHFTSFCLYEEFEFILLKLERKIMPGGHAGRDFSMVEVMMV